MKDDGFPMGKLIALAWDGPNVNKTIFNKLQQMIKDDYPQFSGFVDIGSCVLHVVFNAFWQGSRSALFFVLFCFLIYLNYISTLIQYLHTTTRSYNEITLIQGYYTYYNDLQEIYKLQYNILL